MNSASSDGMPSRTATPLYQPNLSPAMSHTYVNQYAASEYHSSDQDQHTTQVPYTYEVDNYEDYNSQYRQDQSTG